MEPRSLNHLISPSLLVEDEKQRGGSAPENLGAAGLRTYAPEHNKLRTQARSADSREGFFSLYFHLLSNTHIPAR